MHRLLLVAVIVATGSLAACGTPEYQQTRYACYQEWVARIPPDYRQVLVTKERRVEVPDGTETCTTIGYTKRCEKGMRTEWVPYTAVETVDANAHARELRVRECTTAHCMRTFGNAECVL